MHSLVLLAILSSTGLLSAQSPTVVPLVSPSAFLNQNFAGSWAGQLEYKDYGTGQRTFLPTWVETIADTTGNHHV